MADAAGTAEDTTAELLRLARLAADCADWDELQVHYAAAERLILPVIVRQVCEMTEHLPNCPGSGLADLCLEQAAADIIGRTPAGLAYLEVTSHIRRRGMQ